MRPHAPTISIIVPAYNHARWIREALDSVLQQSWQDWELLIIDDASRDNTRQVVQAWLDEQADSRVSLTCHESNQGAPATLNEGLAAARGEFVAILNSDDVWLPQRLECLLEHARQHQLDFVASAVDVWDGDSQDKSGGEPDWLDWYQGLEQDFHTHNDFLRTLLRGNFLITTSNFFFRRSAYLRLGGFGPLRYVHDYEYLLRLWQAGVQMACLWEQPLLHYRLHDSNTIRERPLAAIQENMQMLLGQLSLLSASLNGSRLEGLQIQLTDLYRYTREEWLTELHQQLISKEEGLFELINDRDRWVAERDELIAQQQQWVMDRDQWLLERDQWISERDALIGQLQVLVAGQQATLQERDEHIQRQQAWVTDRDRWIDERDELLRHMKLDRDRLLHSRSYRLGHALLAPVRLLAGWLPHDKQRARHA